MKKKILIMSSVLTLVALTIIGGFRYHSDQMEAEYAGTAVPYIKRVVPELSQWQPEIARQYMSAEFLQKISDADFERTLSLLSRVGSLEELGEPQFAEIYSGDTPSGAKRTIISYTITARYSSGPVEITMSLLDLDGTLKINHFNLQSEALLR